MADSGNKYLEQGLRSGIITAKLPMRSYGQQRSRLAIGEYGGVYTQYLWKDEKGELVWHRDKVKAEWEAVHIIVED